MATYDVTSLNGDGSFQFEKHVPVQLSRTVDWSKLNNGSPVGASSSDTYDIITIPAGFVVEDVYITGITTPTASSALAVADATTAAFYFAAGTVIPAAGTTIKTGTVAGAAGKFKDITSVTTFSASMTKVYDAATTLRVVFAGSLGPLVGKTRFCVRGFYLV